MNKEELIAAIAEKTEFSKADTKRFLDSYIEATTEALSSGDSIQLVGFATLSVTERAERVGRNPQTGKQITIPASKAIKFSAGKQLKEAVNSAKGKAKKKKAA